MKTYNEIVNHHKPEEQNTIREQLSSRDFTHTITITSPAQDVTYGSVWLQLNGSIEKLKALDPNIEYCFFICENLNYDIIGRPHTHGLLKTKLSDRKIRDCVWSYCYRKNKAEPSRKINDTTNRLDSWVNYVLPQSIRGTIFTNIEVTY